MGRFAAMVGAFDAQLDNYDTIKNTALSPVALTVVIGGLAMAALGLWSLLSRRCNGAATAHSSSADMSNAAV